MPVNLLYCEGGPKSPDIRTLSALVSGLCVIAPAGSKYGFGTGIRLARQVRLGTMVAGLRDRDFVPIAAAPIQQPVLWRVDRDQVTLGWYWERVEVENYLIDPVVVAHALGTRAPAAADYSAALQAAAESIADYTAARTALSNSRLRFTPLDNCWGLRRSLDDQPFPDDRTEASCRAAILQMTGQHTAEQFVRSEDVLNRFETVLPECRPGGLRFQYFLTYFSGKDLLLALDLARLGFESARVFRERILVGIENSGEEVWRWLPEWTSLRTQVQTA